MLSWLDSSPVETSAADGPTTVLRLPLRAGDLGGDELEAWLERWDDTALLFCSNVTVVDVRIGGEHVRSLRLQWQALVADGSVRRRRSAEGDELARVIALRPLAYAMV